MLKNILINFICLFVFGGSLFVLSGCATSEEAWPEIVQIYPQEGKIIKPSLPPKSTIEVYGGVQAEWIPPSYLEDRGRWQGIIIHHSGVSYGCAAHEDKYHKSIGWDGLGYDFVINNGVYKNGYGEPDGLVEVGYRWRQQKTGAHCRPEGDWSNYWNEHTIGICLIGDFEKTRPTERQWQSLVKLLRFLQNRYDIPTSQIKGHRDIKVTKCPGRYFSSGELRRRLAQ